MEFLETAIYAAIARTYFEDIGRENRYEKME